MLSDFWPHGAASKAFGTFIEEKGFANRGSFIIDKEGVLRFALYSGMDARNNEDYKKALAAL